MFQFLKNIHHHSSVISFQLEMLEMKKRTSPKNN